MNRKPVSRITLIGRFLLVSGILFLILGIILFISTGSTPALWTILFSVLINVVAISLLTYRKR